MRWFPAANDRFTPFESITGMGGLYTLAGWMLFFAVIGAVVSLMLGALAWGVGTLTNNPDLASKGKRAMLGGGGIVTVIYWLANRVA